MITFTASSLGLRLGTEQKSHHLTLEKQTVSTEKNTKMCGSLFTLFTGIVLTISYTWAWWTLKINKGEGGCSCRGRCSKKNSPLWWTKALREIYIMETLFETRKPLFFVEQMSMNFVFQETWSFQYHLKNSPSRTASSLRTHWARSLISPRSTPEELRALCSCTCKYISDHRFTYYVYKLITQITVYCNCKEYRSI